METTAYLAEAGSLDCWPAWRVFASPGTAISRQPWQTRPREGPPPLRAPTLPTSALRRPYGFTTRVTRNSREGAAQGGVALLQGGSPTAGSSVVPARLAR